jgi:LacI family transcriptional regulator
LHDKGLPIVFFDRITEEMETHKVIANNFNGAYQATEHLINSGFRRIAHLTISPHLSITKERLAGYKAALADHRIPFDETLVKYCRYGGLIEGETEEAVEALLSAKNRPDAIVTASDKLSTGCLAALARKKVKVPDEMGIVGFTNSLLTDIFHPALTSVRQPAFEMGQVAMEMLISLIESKHPVTNFETRMLNTELTVRSSSQKV